MAFNNALFARMPKNKIGHSLYKRPSVNAGTMMHGDIVPVYCKLVSPGEVIKEKVYGNIRMSTPIAPLYSSIKISFNAFFVPLRLVWDHYKEFMGENTSGTSPVVGTYKIPSLVFNVSNSSTRQVKVHSVSHYLHKPLYKGSSVDSGLEATSKLEASILKERAYWSIINRWYRHEQVQNPIIISKADNGTIGSKNGSSLAISSACQKCLKDFDYFTTMTRYPQFGPDVSLPLGSVAPIVTDGSNMHSLGDYLKFGSEDMTFSSGYSYRLGLNGSGENSADVDINADGASVTPGQATEYVTHTNLVADLSSATAATVDELYLAMAAQAWFHNSNYGSRYFEALEIHYSVSNPDLVLQDPEHIGEAKRYIQVQQVLSTAGATNDDTTKLGQPGANSSTNISLEFPRHSFGEWGYFMILANTYHERYYPAGLLKEDTYSDLFDFFFPEFSNIGDTGVARKELFATSSDSDPDSILGFQEAWAEMRYTPNTLTGLFDPYCSSQNGAASGPIKGFVLGEKWASSPSFSEEFLLENREAIKDVLVSGENGPDYLFYFYFDEKTLNEVPLYSVPGLPGRGRGIL